MNGVQVLLVEDDPFIQLSMAELLTDAGFAVRTASSGEEAAALLTDEIQALITDIDLGDGLSGWDLAHRARELNAIIPVVYVTSAPAEEWSANGVPNSVHIHKPFVSVQVITALSQLLNTSSHT